MNIYDLTFGNFTPDANLFLKKRPVIEGFFPFYLYKGDYIMVPDVSQSGSSPFVRSKYVHPEDTSFSETNLIPKTYLLNNQVQGWVLPSNSFQADLPTIQKIFSVSFDVVTLNKMTLTYSDSFQLFEVYFRDNNNQYFVAAKILIKLNLTQMGNTNLFEGEVDVSLYIWNNTLAGFKFGNSMKIPVTGGILNQPSSTQNDKTEYQNYNESKIRMQTVLFRKTFVIQVESLLFEGSHSIYVSSVL